MKNRHVYLDNNATTQIRDEVIEEMKSSFDAFGNSSSMHDSGRKVAKLVEKSRHFVAALINAEDSNEIIFTSGGSESNNTVLKMFADSTFCKCMSESRKEIIISSIEHPSILETAKLLKHKGVPVEIVDVDKYGKVNIEQLKTAVSEKTALVSIMMANNEIGTIQDIKDISKIVHDKGAFFHTDAVQAVGKINVDVQDLDIDYLSCSSHKIHGPKGIGALYVKKGNPYCPLIHGGHQEGSRRAGTLNNNGIIGFGKAASLIPLELNETSKKIRDLREKLKKGIEDNIPDVKFNGHPVDLLPNTLNVSFYAAEGEAILLYLDLEGVSVSTGSACATGSLEPSYVLLATKTGLELAHSSIRFSLSKYTSSKDIDYTIDVLTKTINKIRKMSTLSGRS